MDLRLRDNVTGAALADTAKRFGFTPHTLADVWGGRS
jgi:hypothetical protein